MLKNMFTQHLDIDDGLDIAGAGAEEPEVADTAGSRKMDGRGFFCRYEVGML